MTKRTVGSGLILVIALLIAIGFGLKPAAHSLGAWLIQDEPLERADAAVVLSTGVEYYARLMEAAALYEAAEVEWVVINGNRKSAERKQLEGRGLVSPCPWQEESLRILELLGVPREAVIAISAPDVFDTVSEARWVGEQLRVRGLSRLTITTSKSHTRRAGHIWRHTFGNEFTIGTAAAREDPYDPAGWWREGRQIRWLLAEYGAWLFLLFRPAD